MQIFERKISIIAVIVFFITENASPHPHWLSAHAALSVNNFNPARKRAYSRLKFLSSLTKSTTCLLSGTFRKLAAL